MNVCQRCHLDNMDLNMCCTRCGAELLPPLIAERMKEEAGHLLDDDNLVPTTSVESDLRDSRRNVESLLDYLGRQAVHNMRLFITVEKLVKWLDQAGILDRASLERSVRRELKGQVFAHEQRQQLESRKQAIIVHCQGSRAEHFGAAVNRAIPLLYTARHHWGMRLLQGALRMDPDNAELLQTLAEIHFIRGELEKAKRLVGRIRDLQPENLSGELLQALIHLKKGTYSAALACLENVQQVVPTSFIANFLLGVAYFLKQNFTRAGDLFSATYHFRQLPQLPLLGAMAFCLDRRPGKAEQLSKKAISAMGCTGFCHFLNGLISLQRNWLRKSESHFRKAAATSKKWEIVIEKMRQSGPEQSRRLQSQIFTAKLRHEMEGLMTLLISEIQTIQP